MIAQLVPGTTPQLQSCGTHDGYRCDSTFSVDGQHFGSCTDSLLALQVANSHVQVWFKASGLCIHTRFVF